MKPKFVFLLLILVANVTATFASPPIKSLDETIVAFVNVNVVPMDTERVLSNQTVIQSNRHD